MSICFTPQFNYFMANNVMSLCQCPNQCSKLTYNYAVSQAITSQHAIQWARSSVMPNVSEELIVKNFASMEVD